MPASISEYVPQCAAGERDRVERRALAVWCGVAVAALSLVCVIVAAPMLASGGHETLARAIYSGLAPFCHQIAERSFHVWGAPLAVCARCTGLYAGFALGVLLYPLVRPLGSRTTPWRGWLIASVVPTSLDFALGYFGFLENTHLSRSLTGALFGTVATLYVVPGLVDLSHMRREKMFRVRASAGE